MSLELGVGSYTKYIDNCSVTDQVLDNLNITSTTVHAEVNNDLTLTGRSCE